MTKLFTRIGTLFLSFFLSWSPRIDTVFAETSTVPAGSVLLRPSFSNQAVSVSLAVAFPRPHITPSIFRTAVSFRGFKTSMTVRETMSLEGKMRKALNRAALDTEARVTWGKELRLFAQTNEGQWVQHQLPVIKTHFEDLMMWLQYSEVPIIRINNTTYHVTLYYLSSELLSQKANAYMQELGVVDSNQREIRIYFKNSAGLIREGLEHLIFPADSALPAAQRHALAFYAEAIAGGEIFPNDVVIPQRFMNQAKKATPAARRAFFHNFQGRTAALAYDIFSVQDSAEQRYALHMETALHTLVAPSRERTPTLEEIAIDIVDVQKLITDILLWSKDDMEDAFNALNFYMRQLAPTPTLDTLPRLLTAMLYDNGLVPIPFEITEPLNETVNDLIRTTAQTADWMQDNRRPMALESLGYFVERMWRRTKRGEPMDAVLRGTVAEFQRLWGSLKVLRSADERDFVAAVLASIDSPFEIKMETWKAFYRLGEKANYPAHSLALLAATKILSGQSVNQVWQAYGELWHEWLKNSPSTPTRPLNDREKVALAILTQARLQLALPLSEAIAAFNSIIRAPYQAAPDHTALLAKAALQFSAAYQTHLKIKTGPSDSLRTHFENQALAALSVIGFRPPFNPTAAEIAHQEKVVGKTAGAIRATSPIFQLLGSEICDTSAREQADQERMGLGAFEIWLMQQHSLDRSIVGIEGHTDNGSGTVVAEDRDYAYLFTNAHVVKDQRILLITTKIDGVKKSVPGEVLARQYGYDHGIDLALVAISKTDLRAINATLIPVEFIGQETANELGGRYLSTVAGFNTIVRPAGVYQNGLENNPTYITYVRRNSQPDILKKGDSGSPMVLRDIRYRPRVIALITAFTESNHYIYSHGISLVPAQRSKILHLMSSAVSYRDSGIKPSDFVTYNRPALDQALEALSIVFGRHQETTHPDVRHTYSMLWQDALFKARIPYGANTQATLNYFVGLVDQAWDPPSSETEGLPINASRLLDHLGKLPPNARLTILRNREDGVHVQVHDQKGGLRKDIQLTPYTELKAHKPHLTDAIDAIANGVILDLKQTGALLLQENFTQIVLHGIGGKLSPATLVNNMARAFMIYETDQAGACALVYECLELLKPYMGEASNEINPAGPYHIIKTRRPVEAGDVVRYENSIDWLTHAPLEEVNWIAKKLGGLWTTVHNIRQMGGARNAKDFADTTALNVNYRAPMLLRFQDVITALEEILGPIEFPLTKEERETARLIEVISSTYGFSLKKFTLEALSKTLKLAPDKTLSLVNSMQETGYMDPHTKGNNTAEYRLTSPASWLLYEAQHSRNRPSKKSPSAYNPPLPQSTLPQKKPLQQRPKQRAPSQTEVSNQCLSKFLKLGGSMRISKFAKFFSAWAKTYQPELNLAGGFRFALRTSNGAINVLEDNAQLSAELLKNKTLIVIPTKAAPPPLSKKPAREPRLRRTHPDIMGEQTWHPGRALDFMEIWAGFIRRYVIFEPGDTVESVLVELKRKEDLEEPAANFKAELVTYLCEDLITLLFMGRILANLSRTALTWIVMTWGKKYGLPVPLDAFLKGAVEGASFAVHATPPGHNWQTLQLHWAGEAAMLEHYYYSDEGKIKIAPQENFRAETLESRRRELNDAFAKALRIHAVTNPFAFPNALTIPQALRHGLEFEVRRIGHDYVEIDIKRETLPVIVVPLSQIPVQTSGRLRKVVRIDRTDSAEDLSDYALAQRRLAAYFVSEIEHLRRPWADDAEVEPEAFLRLVGYYGLLPVLSLYEEPASRKESEFRWRIHQEIRKGMLKKYPWVANQSPEEQAQFLRRGEGRSALGGVFSAGLWRNLPNHDVKIWDLDGSIRVRKTNPAAPRRADASWAYINVLKQLQAWAHPDYRKRLTPEMRWIKKRYRLEFLKDLIQEFNDMALFDSTWARVSSALEAVFFVADGFPDNWPAFDKAITEAITAIEWKLAELGDPLAKKMISDRLKRQAPLTLQDIPAQQQSVVAQAIKEQLAKLPRYLWRVFDLTVKGWTPSAIKENFDLDPSTVVQYLCVIQRALKENLEISRLAGGPVSTRLAVALLQSA